MKRYELTEDGFKRNFRACRPEPGETFSQFSVRLASYLTKRIEMSDCLKTYEALFDLMMRDQFLHICNKELTLYLKERIPPSLQQMATLADQFKEARLTSAVSLTYPSGTKKSNSKPRQGSVNQFDTGKKQESSGFRKGEMRCFRCGSSSHMVMNCPIKHNKVGNITSGSYSRSQSNSQYGVGQEVYHLILGLDLRIQIGVDHQQEMKGKEQQVGKVNTAMMQLQHVEPVHYIKTVLLTQR